MSTINRSLAVCYGVLSYLAFLLAFSYAIGFVGNIGVPRSVDHTRAAPAGAAVALDLVLLGLFAVQHSVMARPAFKRRWTRIVPQPVERSTYVLIASAVLVLLYWQWRSIPAHVWDVKLTTVRFALWGLFWAGWAIVLATTFMISHLELFGLRQVYLCWRGEPHTDVGFRLPLLYRVIRHPMMLGFIVAFWAAPTMTSGHLLFAAAATGYILLALHLEERDLVTALGAEYVAYRRQVPMLLPQPRRSLPSNDCPERS
jgi:protein-S-isoprenylcysteine O-methyltransferase Ste14